jgi:hypothetical protein
MEPMRRCMVHSVRSVRPIALEADMDRFLRRQNIDRFRVLAAKSTDASERKSILNLLAEEEAKFRLDMASDRFEGIKPKAPKWSIE